MWIFLLITLCTICNGLAYKAAVVEYYPSTEAQPMDTIKKNIEEYRTYVDSARKQSVDIIVFPEYGLTTLTKDPEEYAVEITSTNEIISKLSTLAKEHEMYLVINLLEKETIANQIYYYNTNLVFDRNGTTIAKYRKINLFDEAKLTPGSFGVTFGIFTCFDILFKSPSRTVLESTKVTDIVYPTAWISIIPFYHSLSVQHGYAVANGVNLLAANYAKPNAGRGGSGIYLTDGKIAEKYIGDTASTKLIVQEVGKQSTREDRTKCPTRLPFGLPSDLGKSNVSNYMALTAFTASDYTFQNINLTQGNISETVCHKNFCCNFDLKLDPNNVIASEHYKLMAYDGMVNYNEIQLHIRTCSLLFCENDSNDSCGKRQETTSTKFTKITVSGNLPTDNTTFYTPVTLNTYLLTIPQIPYCDTQNGTDTTYVQLSTPKAQQNLLVFGLLGHTQAPIDDHNDNGDDDDGNSAVKASSLLLLVVLSVVKCLLY
nr:PREDICTED: vanin-like protein 1 [Tribolium castaneum]|eukprot:XP_008196062.1 PREDICTED: vanin-like protein 1 [Tribolium castaneum]